ncbi:hypothetical protein WJD75_22690 [Salmonella enterica subsp. enterica serovar Corvallis]|nr:hypothetical protein [Salmonella enterica subsp. enterica serovar Derby]
MSLPKYEEPVYLHVEQVNGRSMIVDQDGRMVAGVIDFQFNIPSFGEPTITVTIEPATHGENGKIHFNTGA